MIRLFSLGGVRVECGAAMLILTFLALMYAGVERVAVIFISLTLHESSHTLTALRLGYGVASVELQPFGFVARIAGDFASPSDELRVASSGPFSSAVAACAALALERALPESALVSEFARFNLTLAAVNLMPALPLDGGRMLRALFRGGRASSVLAWTGVAFGALLSACALWLMIRGAAAVTPLLMGLFMIPASARELRRRGVASAMARVRRGDALRRGASVEVRYRAVSGEMSVREAVTLLSASRYTVLTVVDEGMRALGSVDEGRLMNAMALYGGGARLRDVMRRAD